MNSLQVQAVARQITAIRWLPPRAGSAYTDTDLYFVSGSSGKHKELVLWTAANPDFRGDSDSSSALATLAATTGHDGDVHDIVAPAPGLVATASSYGTISVYDVAHAGASSLALREAVTAHRFANDAPAVATALAAQPGNGADVEIASCGEDGRLAYAPIARLDALQRHEVDSTVATGICWPMPTQLAVATRAGQVKLFDRRAPADAQAVFVDPASSHAFECIAAHPSQSFRLATGSDTGAVLLWDIRNPKRPATQAFNVHGANVWAVQFHPEDSAKLVSCSEDATLAVTQWAADADGLGHDVRRLSSFFNPLSVNCFDVCPFTRTSLVVAGSSSGNLLMDAAPCSA
ncbi:hypothetical protein LPJ63_001814 [Coemansia sp. RSA 2711]|nr:hypothetical protein LPJ63_001814 [Coemansia sp. RSA 2711]